MKFVINEITDSEIEFLTDDICNHEAQFGYNSIEDFNDYCDAVEIDARMDEAENS